MLPVLFGLDTQTKGRVGDRMRSMEGRKWYRPDFVPSVRRQQTELQLIENDITSKFATRANSDPYGHYSVKIMITMSCIDACALAFGAPSRADGAARWLLRAFRWEASVYVSKAGTIKGDRHLPVCIKRTDTGTRHRIRA